MQDKNLINVHYAVNVQTVLESRIRLSLKVLNESKLILDSEPSAYSTYLTDPDKQYNQLILVQKWTEYF